MRSNACILYPNLSPSSSLKSLPFPCFVFALSLWPGAYRYMTDLLGCPCRRHIYSNEETKMETGFTVIHCLVMTLLWWWLVPMSYIRWILHGNYFARCSEETPTPPSIFLGLTWHEWKVNVRPASPGWLNGLEGLPCVQEVVSSNPSRFMSVIPVMKYLTLQDWWCDCLLLFRIVSWFHSCNHGEYGRLLVQTLLPLFFRGHFT